MASLELEGKIKTILPAQSGNSARGEWVRQDFVVEFPDGNFTAEACFSAWGQDKVNELARYQVGSQVKVSFNVKAREYSGRWYNDLRVWKISPAGQQDGQQRPVAAAPAPAPMAPPPTLDDLPGESDEDLPF